MPARAPEELDELFTSAMNAGDLEAVVALYEPNASLASQPGQVVTGTAAIREAVRGFLARKPKFTAEAKPTVHAGELAMTRPPLAVNRDGTRWFTHQHDRA
jgi:uncharacterized protein (TIGR02246 family)